MIGAKRVATSFFATLGMDRFVGTALYSIKLWVTYNVSLRNEPRCAREIILYRKRYRVAFHYIRYRSLTISLQRNAIADPPWQNPHSQDIDIKRGKEVKLSCETALFVVAPRTFGGGMATTWLLPLSHK